MKALRFLVVFTFLFAGCATPTSMPTAIVVEPTETIAPLPTPTEIVELPTATPQPTDIPATRTPNARQQEQALIAPLIAPCNLVTKTYSSSSGIFSAPTISYSPSKTWVVVSCESDKPKADTITKLARMDGSKQWGLSFNDIYIQTYQPNNASMILSKTFLPIHWTKNEDFVYLGVHTSSSKRDGYNGLFRMDLSTGKISAVLKPSIGPLDTTYVFKFSPSGTKLAYSNQSVTPVSIMISDLTASSENKITLDARFTETLSLLWSLDEKQLVASVLAAYATGENRGVSVILYDLDTAKNEYILQDIIGYCLLHEWLDTTTIYAEVCQGSSLYVHIDPITKEITKAPTPTVAP